MDARAAAADEVHHRDAHGEVDGAVGAADLERELARPLGGGDLRDAVGDVVLVRDGRVEDARGRLCVGHGWCGGWWVVVNWPESSRGS